jgi:DegV family protein with EDD domain
MTVAIVTDSGCDFPQDTAEGIAGMIKIVPLLFRFGLEEFLDRSMPMQYFAERIEQTWPKTSAPAPGDFLKAFRESLVDHDRVICITLTSKHTSSYASAMIASQYFPEGQVTVIDSASLSFGQGLQVMEALKVAQAGGNLEEVVARVRDVQRRSSIFIALDTVKYLVMGGRASQLTGMLAGVLQIRPILTLVEGQLTVLDKVRGRAASKLNLLKHAITSFPAELVAVGHWGCAAEALEIASSLAHQTGFLEDAMYSIEVGMVLATHSGPGVLGILVVSQSEALL